MTNCRQGHYQFRQMDGGDITGSLFGSNLLGMCILFAGYMLLFLTLQLVYPKPHHPMTSQYLVVQEGHEFLIQIRNLDNA